jgi:hypothetical protein
MSEYTYGTYACQVIVGYDQWGGSLADRPRKSLAPETRLRLCIAGYGAARATTVREDLASGGPLCTARLRCSSYQRPSMSCTRAGKLDAWSLGM